MKRKVVMIFSMVFVLATLIVASASAAGQADLAAVRAATAHFQRSEVSEAAGYVNVNVGECVELPGVGGMGFHFVNFALVDFALDPLSPEALVYAPSPSGKMKLVAVEYLVPAEPWDANFDYPPSVLGQDLHLNPQLGLYVLHAWVWQNNPAGMFEDWNPTVACSG
jgi:hypothetical protein